MNRCLLVTGANGVLGQAIKKYVKDKSNKEFKKYVFLSSKNCDLTNDRKVKTLFKKINPSHIIHLAAKSGGIGVSKNNFQATLLTDNLKMMINILENSKNSKVKKVILTLSSGMYPPNAKMPYKENSIHQGEVERGSYGYFFAKRLMEPSIRAYRDQYNLDVIGLVPNGIYGENDKFDLDTSPMLPSLIKKIYKAKIYDSSVEVWGDGSPLREYTYANDLAKIYFWALKNYKSREILNIGSTEERSVKQIAYLISDIIKLNRKKIFFNKNKPNGIIKKNTSNYNFKKIKNFKYTKLKKGLKNTIEWYIKNYKTISKDQSRF